MQETNTDEATIYYGDDADMAVLDGQTIAIIGYGNQGRAQALNMRDSGVEDIVIGNRSDESREQAKEDGFEEPVASATGYRESRRREIRAGQRSTLQRG